MQSYKRLQELIADIFDCEAQDVNMDLSFEDDLYADSMDAIELAIMLEEEFDLKGLTEMDFSQFTTVGDVARFLSKKLDG